MVAREACGQLRPDIMYTVEGLGFRVGNFEGLRNDTAATTQDRQYVLEEPKQWNLKNDTRSSIHQNWH